jgi:type 1 glutamine amidotransferase
VAEILSRTLQEHSFETEVSATLDAFKDAAKLKTLDLIVPVWTGGKIEREQEKPLLEAVQGGVGIAGCHGGMCDSFRNNTEYQFMTGGQWVAHPGNDGVRYMVNITDPRHFITVGSKDFDVVSEQYYMHVDPANEVLATTSFPIADGPHVPNGQVRMPVVWTRRYGKGRVAYCSLGHVAKVVNQPEVLRLITRCLLWAANAENLAK